MSSTFETADSGDVVVISSVAVVDSDWSGSVTELPGFGRAVACEALVVSGCADVVVSSCDTVDDSVDSGVLDCS